MKKITYILIIPAVCLLLFWAGSIIKCEILTYLHEKEFATLYKETRMIDSIDYFKVINYSPDFVQVYYVSKNICGDTITFEKKQNQWELEKWETIWSKTGSADGFVWPYIR